MRLFAVVLSVLLSWHCATAVNKNLAPLTQSWYVWHCGSAPAHNEAFARHVVGAGFVFANSRFSLCVLVCVQSIHAVSLSLCGHNRCAMMLFEAFGLSNMFSPGSGCWCWNGGTTRSGVQREYLQQEMMSTCSSLPSRLASSPLVRRKSTSEYQWRSTRSVLQKEHATRPC
jgi:hypothetical protein